MYLLPPFLRLYQGWFQLVRFFRILVDSSDHNRHRSEKCSLRIAIIELALEPSLTRKTHRSFFSPLFIEGLADRCT